MHYIFSILLTLSFIFSNTIYAQQPSPKRETRAVWIATVGNIDWPSKRGLSAQQQQQEYIQHLNFLKQTGFNTVITQVRPAADALYESEIEPWSTYLSGKQGQPPFPKYDPLTFMIDETHKRNMEFHAWLNPYRALVSSANNPNPADHVTKTHPEWIIHYDGKGYFDPGNPEVREYILNVFMDVVKRYDLDALHIDDYFYPYPVAGKTFNDQKSYQKYGNGLSLADWRRNNVNLFISQLSRMIKQEKPWVKFGVSPFGVWRNINKDQKGSNTIGATACYDDLYSDILLWIDKKWVDYVAPQLYWEHNHRIAPYNVLLPWWKDNVGNTELYAGLGVYRMVNASASSPYFTPKEILKQIDAARKEKINGVVMYSLASFGKISKSLSDSLKYNQFGNIAVPQAFYVKGMPLPEAPHLSIQKQQQYNVLHWDLPKTHKSIGKEKYLVYRFNIDDLIDLTSSENIVVLTSNKSFIDKNIKVGAKYKYVVTTLDRTWNESSASNIISL